MKLFVLYSILFSSRKFILIVGSTKELATNSLADIVDMLDSQNIRSVWGNWRHNIEVDRQDFKKFTFCGRPIILKAVGAQTSIRGIAVKNSRPDVIVCDDAQTEECSQSPVESRKFITWFLGTLLKAKSDKGCTYIYIGNMYKDLELEKDLYGCMLRNLQKNSAWTSFIVGAILSDGKALWEELQPLEQLLAELKQDTELKQEAIFYAEVLNDPGAISSRVLDVTKLDGFVWPEDELVFGNFIIIDPSAGKKKSDDLAIGYFEMYGNVPVLRELRTGKFSPLETIHEAFKMAIRHGCGCIISEDVAYQSTLLFWFNLVAEQLGLHGINFLPINPKGQSKAHRIVNNFFRAWEAGEILVAKPLFSTVLNQATRYNPLKKDNVDDILDLCAYATRVPLEYPSELVIQGNSTEASFENIPLVEDFSNQTQVF